MTAPANSRTPAPATEVRQLSACSTRLPISRYGWPLTADLALEPDLLAVILIPNPHWRRGTNLLIIRMASSNRHGWSFWSSSERSLCDWIGWIYLTSIPWVCSVSVQAFVTLFRAFDPWLWPLWLRSLSDPTFLFILSGWPQSLRNECFCFPDRSSFYLRSHPRSHPRYRR